MMRFGLLVTCAVLLSASGATAQSCPPGHPSAPWPGPAFVPTANCQGWVPAGPITAPVLTANGVKGPLVSTDYLSQTLQDLPPDASIQVVRLTPDEGAYQLLVVVRRPGETSAELRFYQIDRIEVLPPNLPRQVTCPAGFVQTITPGGCVPPNHPLARQMR